MDSLCVVLGLITGAATAVSVSCVWCVLLLPARVQDRLQAASSRTLTWAIALGMMLSTLGNAADFRLHLPEIAASALLIPCGMFVGMLASALEEILEVVPVIMRRFRLGNVSAGMRWVMLIAKGLGAVIASLVFTL